MARKSRKAASKARKKPAKKSSKKPRAKRAKKSASRKKRMSTAGKAAHRKFGKKLSKKSSKKPDKKIGMAASVSLVSAHKGAPARKHDPDATMNMLALLVLLMIVLGSGSLYWQHQAGGATSAQASLAMEKK